MRYYSFTVTTYDARQPWIVLEREPHTIELDDDIDFSAWARARWPPPTHRIDVDGRTDDPWPASL